MVRSCNSIFLVGTYKLVSVAMEIDVTPGQAMSKAPQGYFILTPTRAIQFYTYGDRKFGTFVDEKAGLFNMPVAWSGIYRVEGDKIVEIVDASWVENLNGTTTVSTWQLSGNRLTLTSPPTRWPKDPPKTMILRQVWEKVE